MKFFISYFRQWAILFLSVAFISSCLPLERTTTQLSLSFGSKASSRMVTRAPISSVYPSLSSIQLSVTTATLSVEDINEQYNNNAFTLNAEKTAFVLTDTVVNLVVPNDEDVTITILAFNSDDIQFYSGTTLLSVAELADPVVDVVVPMVVDIVTTIPIYAGDGSSDTRCADAGGHDNDNDGLCSLYEDLFLNSAGQPDIDNNGTVNSLDSDSDGDGLSDDFDYNFRAIFNDQDLAGHITISNNGYPMFVVANRVPVITDQTISILENETVTLTWTPELYDQDVTDNFDLFSNREPANGSVTIDDVNDTITYTPDVAFSGDDSFEIEVVDIASSEVGIAVTVSVTVEPDFAFNETYQSTPGAHVVLDVLQNDIFLEGATTLTITQLSADIGQVRMSEQTDEIFFVSSPSDSGTASIEYTVQDNLGNTAIAIQSVVLNTDGDGDGLSTSVLTNGASDLDPNDQDWDTDLDSQPDLFESIKGLDLAVSDGDLQPTYITGDISVDTVWTMAESPILISGTTINVTNGANLQIEQGTVVKFQDTLSELVISDGTLTVLGGQTDTLRVKFISFHQSSIQSIASDVVWGTASAEPVDDEWVGLRINSTGNHFISNLNIAHSTEKSFVQSDGIVTAKNLMVDSRFDSLGEPILVNGVNAELHLSDSVFEVGFVGITVSSGAASLTNVEVGHYTVCGLSLNTTGTVEMESLTVYSNGQGICLDQVGGGSYLRHSVVRNNETDLAGINGAGIFVHDPNLTGNTFEISNNLILENATLGGLGGGIYVETDGHAVIYGNTIVENYAGGNTVGGSGVYIASATASALSSDNILFQNTNINDVPDTTDNVVDASGTFTNGFNLINIDPEFSGSYFLNQAGLNAIDAGSMSMATVPVYLENFASPTTNLAGTADDGQMDIGYHYDGAAVQPSAIQSTLSPISSVGSPIDLSFGDVQLWVTPRDANGFILGGGLNIEFDLSNVEGDVGRDLILYGNGTVTSVRQLGKSIYVGAGVYTVNISDPLGGTCDAQPIEVPIVVNGIVIGSVFPNLDTTLCG